jgi:peptidylprolyl isomerase domain and WD repeat-containing protein 1
VIEYWDVDTFQQPTVESRKISFHYKSDTDLYDLAKSKTVPCVLSVSPLGDQFAVTSRDKIIRVFDFARGKLKRKYDESVAAYQVWLRF